MQKLFRQIATRRSALPMVVALLLAFQAGLAGLAIGAAGSNYGLLAQICATDKATDKIDHSNDSSPPISHHGGACCILQNNILTEPDVGPESIIILARVIEAPRPSPQYRIDAVIVDPELEPSSPRGPPAQVL